MSVKKFLILFFIIFYPLQGFCDETIKAQNNAYRHNNKGLLYLEDKYYFGAIKEFEIAIDLNPKSQASAIFYTNLGKTYETIGYDNLAQINFEKALSLNPLCFEYYLNLAQNYKKLGIIEEKLTYYSAKTNSPLNSIMVGLLYIQKGNVTTGITVLDDFCDKEPNLLITSGVKKYIKELTDI